MIFTIILITIVPQGPAFMLMENVQSFIQAAKKYGVPDEEMFLTPDLFEGRNLSQVWTGYSVIFPS